MATTPESAKLGHVAPSFSLPATDGKTYALSDVAGPKGTVVVFICNHCPYVKAITDRLVEDAQTLAEDGIGFVAICSNDSTTHPADSFENMKLLPRNAVLAFHICTTRINPSRMHMKRFARLISSDWTPKVTCSIADVWMKGGPNHLHPVPKKSWLKPCVWSRRPVRHLNSRSLRLDVASNGRRLNSRHQSRPKSWSGFARRVSVNLIR